MYDHPDVAKALVIPGMHIRRGDIHFMLGNFSASIQDYHEALRIVEGNIYTPYRIWYTEVYHKIADAYIEM